MEIRVRVADLRQCLDPVEQDLGPFVDFFRTVALDRVLKLRIAAPAADTNVLGRLEKKRGAGQRKPGTKTSDHLIGADLAFLDRLQLNIELPIASAADRRGHILYCWIRRNDIHKLR